jgi:predicted amidohydrolase
MTATGSGSDVQAPLIRVATCAFPTSLPVDKSVELHLALIGEAKAAGASLVVFPETGLQGYPSDAPPEGRLAQLREMQRTAEAVPTGPRVAELIAAAVAHDIHVVFGLTEASEQPGILYNTLVLAGPDGYIGSYRKVHLTVGEHVYWRQGREWPVFDTAIGKIGLLICWDKMFPESCRELTFGGAEILVMGTAWPEFPDGTTGRDNSWVAQYEMLDRVRAMENGRWFISANLVGDVDGSRFFGLSQVVDPVGRAVASTGLYESGLAFADIDVAGGLAEVSAMLQGPYVVRDRRPETYRRTSGIDPILIEG